VEMSGRITKLPARLTTVPCSIPVVSRGPALASPLHFQGRYGARLDNQAYGPRQRSRPKGRDEQGK
jgi:hypothetical protein